ncbi:hypothetical protein ACGF0K_06890 [Streptomyces sp. NPDC048156]|uniref:hypothetical protein n=1 Tax=Streptomyces sp. NPDC048156 TaxID=3365502 RepID=UPI003720ECF7
MDELKCYRLTLTTTGVGTVMDGRWIDLATALRKFRSWLGSYGSMPGARIELSVQTADGTWIELRAWPDGTA